MLGVADFRLSRKTAVRLFALVVAVAAGVALLGVLADALITNDPLGGLAVLVLLGACVLLVVVFGPAVLGWRAHRNRHDL